MSATPLRWAFKLMLWVLVAIQYESAAHAESRGGNSSPSYGRDAASPGLAAPNKIRVTVNGSFFLATLEENETAKDFASLLPLTLTMDDLFGREKFAGLPRAISTTGPRSSAYEVGDVILWSPGPDVAIFYRHDGKTIPAPGSILIARADAGVNVIAVPGTVTVKLEAVVD